MREIKHSLKLPRAQAGNLPLQAPPGVCPGVSLRLSLGPEGWRLSARGPQGAASMLLPGRSRNVAGSLAALCAMVSKDNLGKDNLGPERDNSASAAGCGGCRCERRGGLRGFAPKHLSADDAGGGDAA